MSFNINYSKCILCQQNSDDLVNATTIGRQTLCNNLVKFIEYKPSLVPKHIIGIINKNQATELIVNNNQAEYHKICKNKFHPHKLEDLKSASKRTSDSTVCSIPLKRIRNSDPINETQPDLPTYKDCYEKVLNDLVTTIKKKNSDSNSPQIFKLSELSELMTNRMKELDYEDAYIHHTRLKDQLLKHIPDLRSELIGKDIRLFFESDLSKILEKYLNVTEYTEDTILSKASKILRSEIIQENQEKFDGSFAGRFKVENTVSKTLITFVQSLLEPSENGMDRDKDKNICIAENIAQLIKFNSLNYRKNDKSTQHRHSIAKEQPLPLYIGLYIHSSTQQRHLVDELNRLGLSVSYTRILEIENALSSKICKMYSNEEMGCLPSLSQNQFTTAAIDNIDNNPVSTSAKYSFHGTGIFIIQHHDKVTESQNSYIKLEKSDFKSLNRTSLPTSYYDVPPLTLSTTTINLSNINWESKSDAASPLKFVREWLHSSKSATQANSFNGITSWSAYNSRLPNLEASKYRSTSTMLPLLKDKITDPAVVRHAMDIIISIVNKVNPDQVPVITADCPVYIIAKQIQWNYPSKYGDDKLVILQGGLHIEMAFINVIGTWLEGSGWDEVLVKADLTTPLRALSILKSGHVKRSRYAHEVNLIALSILLFENFKCESECDNQEEYEAWILTKCKTSPQYKYWVSVMEMEAILLQFIKSTREANFDDYVTIVEKMCPWFIVTHHHNYARWLPVFVRTLKQLPIQHTDVYANFKKGHFTSRKTNKRFSCISDDQFHEQNNKLVKANKTIISSLDDQSKLEKWMVSGPEVVRVLQEYRNQSQSNATDNNLRHHEDNPSFQNQFRCHVKDLVTAYQDCNPFLNTELTSLGNTKRIIKSESAIKFTLEVSQTGDKEYNSYIMDKLIVCKSSIHNTISAIHAPPFKIPKVKLASNDKDKLVSAQKDANTFCKMFIACESRQGDTGEFFKHENSRFPPSISEFGRLRPPSGSSDIVDCILNAIKACTVIEEPIGISALTIDGSLMVESLSPGCAKAIDQYCSNVFNCHIESQLKTYDRVDIIFDQYDSESFNSIECGSRQDVNCDYILDNNTKIPTNWSKFLSNVKVKNQLLEILATNSINRFLTERKELYCSYKDKVLETDSCRPTDVISPTFQKQAKTRIFLHIAHAIQNGHSKIMIRTQDCDVIVIAIYAFKYPLPQIQELWIDYGTKSKKILIPIHIAYKVLDDKWDILLIFHAFTGCRTVSSFFGIGKCKAWNTWAKFQEIDEVFRFILQNSSAEIDEKKMSVLEKFVILMYDKSQNYPNLHECRRRLFSMKGRSVESIPPTLNALKQHALRTILTVNSWVQCMLQHPVYLEPTKYGWIKTANGYNPIWTTISVTDELDFIKSCTCKKCTTKCPCKEKDLSCTQLCKCQNLCKVNKK